MNTNKIRRLRLFSAFITLTCAALFATPALAQVCSNAGPVNLSSQAEVASFQADYGPCTTMVENLTISGADITDLSPLGLTSFTVPAQLLITGNTALANLDGLALTSVYWLEVNINPALTSIDGLSSVTSASGPVFIQGNPVLPNVTGLSGLTSLSFGALSLRGNASLSDLSGVAGITSIGGSLVIEDNDALTNLDAFASLVSVNGLLVMDNDALTSIAGLANLTSVGSNGSVYIRRNPNLASLAGLSGLTSVGGLVIDNNAALSDLDPLSNLISVGNSTSLAIMNNTALTDITGLGNVQGVGFEVVITGNTALSQCSILERLLDQVDDFDPGPGPGEAGIPDVGEGVTISDNLDGCNSIEDIVGPVTPPPPPPPPPVDGPVTPVPTLGSFGLALMVMLILAVGLTRVRRASARTPWSSR